ncbi:hypothetical protein IKP85_06020 [bacterium]|nr:hypothetical protein [bacterium]
MAKTLTIKIGAGTPKKTYDLKGVTTLKFSDSEKTKAKNVIQYIESIVSSITASGSTITLAAKIDKKTYNINFTNCTSLKTIKATAKGKDLTSCNLEALLKAYDALTFNWEKNGKNVNATFLNDTINMSTATEGVKITAGDGKDKITGSKYNDKITAGADNDTISAGGGKDTIYAGAGNDKVNGRNDNDYIEGGAGNDKLYGDAGDDTIKGGNGTDLIEGGDGNDKLYGDAGIDTIKGGNGTDLIEGGDGNDKLYGDAGIDTIKGGAGNDLIEGGAGNDKLYGDAGTDTIKGGSGNDSIYAGSGNDRIYAGTGNDYINAGKGDNILYFGKSEGYNNVVNGSGTDIIYFNKESNIKNVKYVYSGKDLILTSGGTIVNLNNYKNGHSAKYIQVGNIPVTIKEFLKTAKKTTVPENPTTPTVPTQPTTPTAPTQPTTPTAPTDPTTPSYITVNGTRVTVGTDNADTLTTSGQSPNRLYAHGGDDNITTGDSWTTNYIYAGAGNDIITSGAARDFIYGGSGENTIYLSAGSGNDYTYDENDNTFVFKDITDLNQLTFSAGVQDSLGTVADLTITGYGNSDDSLTIKCFFNIEGYDYSKIKLQAGENGTPVSLYELINKSDLKTSYFTGYWKARPKAITTSPAQKAPQIDSVIYGNTPGVGSHNVLLGTAGGNNTFYSGGSNAGIAGSGAYGATMIYGGDGDETFHTEGNIIYFNDNGTLRPFEQESIYVVDKPNGTKEVSMGVYYRTSETETPIGSYKDYYGKEHHVFYTEDADKIAQISDDDKFGTSFVYTVDNHQYTVNCITSSVLAVEGGGGNDTFYTGYGADGDDGNDTIIGSGVMYGGRGDDKFVLTDAYKDSLSPMYNVYTNSGNDYVDTKGVPNNGSNVVVEFDEGVNTLVVDGSRNVNIIIGESKTYQQEETDIFIETRYLWQARNTHYTAFEKNGDLYIVSNNSTKSQDQDGYIAIDGKGAGVLILKGWTNLSDTQKDNITISYRELLATTNYTSSTYTIKEFLKIIDGTSDSYIDYGNGRHTYMDGDKERINETYIFETIDNSNGELSVINQFGDDVTTTRNIYDDYGELDGTDVGIVDYFIIGSNGSQTIRGGGGNDVIFGDNINGHDNDGRYIYETSNDGNDVIFGGKGNDYIIGGGGNDTIHGGSGTDYLDGGKGDDLLVGGTLGTEEEFNKSVLTNIFNLKEIHGGDGADTIYSLGSYDDDVTFNEAESKQYLGGNTYFRNNIYAGNGNDIIHSNGFSDKVYAGNGNDTIYSYVGDYNSNYNSNAASEIYGEDGNDRIILKSQSDVHVFGGNGNDVIDAREASVVYYNMLYGDNGNDSIYGSNSWDIIYTGQGDNRVEAGGGNDEIYGSDLWLGRGGDNYIDAGDGNDYIRTSGSSTVIGGAGNDTIYISMGYNNVPSNLYIDGGDGDDTYITDGGYGYDTIVASAGKDVIEFKGFVKDNTSYRYNGNDLVLSYTSDGYPAGLVLKDYKSNGFANYIIKTYGGYDENYAQNGQYSMTDFINYLNGNYQMATNGTNGDDAISAAGDINGLGGNDFILAHSTTSTETNPQIINTGSGNNSVLVQSKYSSITGGAGNDEYNLQSSIATIVDAGGNNSITVADTLNNDNIYFDITLNGNGDNTITSAPNADYCAYKITATGSGKQTINIYSSAQRDNWIYDENNNFVETKTYKTEVTTGSGNDDITVYQGDVNSGAGNDTITATYSATLNGDAGDDSYIVEYQYTSSYSAITLIDDVEGDNKLTINNSNLNGDSAKEYSDFTVIFNVDQSGNYRNFSFHDEVLNTNTDQWYNVDVNDVGYCSFITSENITYEDVQKAFGTAQYSEDEGPHWITYNGGIRMTNGTLEKMETISVNDDYNTTSIDIDAARQAVASWLHSDGRDYADVQAACSVNDSTTARANLVAITEIINENLNWTQNM